VANPTLVSQSCGNPLRCLRGKSISILFFPGRCPASHESCSIIVADRTYALSEDSAMAFDASQDRSSGDSTIHPAPVDPFTGASRQNVQPIDSPSVQPFNGHNNPFSSPDTAGKLLLMFKPHSSGQLRVPQIAWLSDAHGHIAGV